MSANEPAPPDLEAVRTYLGETHADVVARVNELVEGAGRAPKKILDDETQGKVADLVKLITKCRKNAETVRQSEKAKWDAVAAVPHGYFKAMTDKLDKAKDGLERSIGAFLREKEERARAERIAEQRRAEQAAQKARDEADRKAREAETARQHQAAAKAGLKAETFEARAQEAERDATVKPAELARTRSDDLGSVSTLQAIWSFRDLDRATLNLEALRGHIPMDALEKAVRSYIRAGGRDLAGVMIFEDRKAIVR